ncbi:hypothetical protein FB567DRAFT_191675 [Paraphoma chrysanthemicola]|uniref:Uncharacterized protein n=1 Tax=Paraphoma chrysanthemicola TaxID=798071 RepID=A0A8K0VU69_9PLEO|nr:hypothetical protein FB567DRAFT_191675 [Paraphoma chrysanthemicola]
MYKSHATAIHTAKGSTNRVGGSRNPKPCAWQLYPFGTILLLHSAPADCLQPGRARYIIRANWSTCFMRYKVLLPPGLSTFWCARLLALIYPAPKAAPLALRPKLSTTRLTWRQDMLYLSSHMLSNIRFCLIALPTSIQAADFAQQNSAGGPRGSKALMESRIFSGTTLKFEYASNPPIWATGQTDVRHRCAHAPPICISGGSSRFSSGIFPTRPPCPRRRRCAA